MILGILYFIILVILLDKVLIYFFKYFGTFMYGSIYFPNLWQLLGIRFKVVTMCNFKYD